MHLDNTKYNIPNDEVYQEYTTWLVDNKYKILFDNLNLEEYYSNKSSKFKVPKMDYREYGITLFDLGVYVLINSIVNRTTININWIDLTNKRTLSVRIKSVFRKSAPSDLRISKKIDDSIDLLEDRGLIEFISNNVKIPFLEKKYAYIYHIDINRITVAMLRTKVRHTRYFEALGAYLLLITTNFSENTKRVNSSSNGIVIAPRSIRSLSAATISFIGSTPQRASSTKHDEVYIDKYSQRKIDEALDWLEENNLIATVHIYDYQHAGSQKYEEVVYYTTLRNVEGLCHFYKTYIYSDYNQYAKLNEEDALRYYSDTQPKYIITEEYCQKMTNTIQ